MPRPRFNADIIAAIRYKVIDHNGVVDASKAVKLGEMKKLYVKGYKGAQPHDRAIARIDAHLLALAAEVPRETDQQKMSGVSMPSKPRPRIKTVPRPVRIKARLFPADFLAALTAAGIQEDPGEEARQRAAESVATSVQWLVSKSYRPSMPDLRETGELLGEIEHACEKALTIIYDRLALLPSIADSTEALAHVIQTSLNPMIMGLLDVSRGMSGGSDGTTLAQAILATESLRSWARGARMQQEAGMRRETASRKDWAARSPERMLGVALIGTYQALSDQPLGFSRGSSGIAVGKPTGPLIRYLLCLFECARQSLSQDPEFAPLAKHRHWNPSPETLAAWVIQVRENDHERSGEL